MTLFWVLLAALVAYRLGWESGHTTVANECERLGRFYVGKKIYHCTMVEHYTTEGAGYQPKPESKGTAALAAPSEE